MGIRVGNVRNFEFTLDILEVLLYTLAGSERRFRMVLKIDLANFILDKIFCPPNTLLHVWRNLVASCHYLAYSNRPFCTDLWKVLRRQMTPEHFSRNMEVPNCCSATGSYRKIFTAIVQIYL